MSEVQLLNFNEQSSDGPRYHLEVFEGPLDLLLKLIARNKVDIMDIPIALILEQYMEYVSELEKTDSEVAGEFIAMAAELMLIKSKLLLPGANDPSAPDPRAQLVGALMDYKKAKEAAVELNTLYQIYSGRMAKESEEGYGVRVYLEGKKLAYSEAESRYREKGKKWLVRSERRC